MLNRTSTKRWIFFLLLFLLAWGERVLFDFGPNVEFVTVTMLVAGFYLGRIEGLLLPLLTMVLSDLILGNTSIYLFTWTGFLIPALVSGYIFLRNRGRTVFSRIGLGTKAGFGTTMFFFFWTNFGVWLTDSWGMYSNDLSGLIASYINGLPFLRTQLTGTLVFVPLGFTAIELVREIVTYGMPRLFLKWIQVLVKGD